MTTKTSGNLRYNSQSYAKNDELQRQFNLKAVDFFNSAFVPANTASQQFLDIGCGTGDFTRDWLLPRCPPCRRLVAVDASEEMLSYARENSAHQDIQYDYLNIGDDVSDFIEKYGRFDRVYSFFCLNWLKDPAQAMKNVSRLMTPAGECLLQFPAVSPARALWRKMAQLEHWKKFSNVFDGFTPKSHDLEDDIARLSYMRELLDSAGLMANTCELLYGGFDYETPQANIDILLSVNPVGATLSPQETELLRSDVTNEVLKWKSDNDLSARPCMYLVHARKRNE
ncbi:juvenile hormone acid O-methyltransferase-like isoform X1 [Dermacentor variabilis]|uniref:juvenile hormone acid O-methyltransferase-like isoform X1 n=2 Tax=Dermacentor variabilis TaxID=34621 RepID=UPI003F5BC13D